MTDKLNDGIPYQTFNYLDANRRRIRYFRQAAPINSNSFRHADARCGDIQPALACIADEGPAVALRHQLLDITFQIQQSNRRDKR